VYSGFSTIRRSGWRGLPEGIILDPGTDDSVVLVHMPDGQTPVTLGTADRRRDGDSAYRRYNARSCGRYSGCLRECRNIMFERRTARLGQTTPLLII
jgi:hypothetical protein